MQEDVSPDIRDLKRISYLITILPVPWESCISIGNGFAYGYDDDYKPPRELVKLLINVVTRGGNLALNLGAQPDGRLPRNGMKAALGLGKWLKEYGEAIFGTRAAKCDYEHGEFGFTRKADSIYALNPLKREKRFPNVCLYPGAERKAARTWLAPACPCAPNVPWAECLWTYPKANGQTASR